MPKVTFLPMNQVFEAREGESILDVALNNDVPIMHACGGFCACTTCHILVKDGVKSLSEVEEMEEERLDYLSEYTLDSRLGCQAKVHGDVTVHVVNLED